MVRGESGAAGLLVHFKQFQERAETRRHKLRYIIVLDP